MRPAVRAIDINACAPKVEVDHGISLSYYYRIAGNLLKQASIYREERNLIDLYIILLRFSSLICETIPSHRDYPSLLLKEKAAFKKKLLVVINELEALKPDVERQVNELNRGLAFHSTQEMNPYNSTSVKKQMLPSVALDQASARNTTQSLLKSSSERSQIASSNYLQAEEQFQKLSLIVPHPKEETLSRHSILGPSRLQGQWTGPITGIRVQYPSNLESTQSGTSFLNQDGQYGSVLIKESESRKSNYDLESVLSLNDGRWLIPTEDLESLNSNAIQEDHALLNIRQPSPPPVLAQLQPHVIPPSKVADPRPGPPKSLQDVPDSKAYQDLHVPVKMLESFLRLAEKNTAKNLETCGVLAGSLKNRMFYVTTLIIPKQESTSDSCQTTDEEEIFNVQDKLSLFPLGWIHTHPTQTCFMSSIDLHTHYSYQIMLPEAIAIVMAPSDTSRTHGIFHLTDPSGVSLIRNCRERGFHPHEEPPDGSPIYEHCSHVYMNTNMKYDVIDLRSA